MSIFITISSATIIILASILTAVPSLWQFVSSTSSQVISEKEARVHALATTQNYTYITVFADPLVIYIDNFLSITEIDQLLNDSSSLFVPSQVFAQDARNPQHRTSSSCSLPAEDLLPSVISARALSFLDSILANPTSSLPKSLSYYGLEPLQLVKYTPSQYYHHHVDWFDALIRDDLPGKGARGKGRGRLYNRVASFFLYLEDKCVGGGTEFPHLKLEDSMIFAGKDEPAEESPTSAYAGPILQDEDRETQERLEFWKLRINIEHREDRISKRTSQTVFKPRKGSGVFWVNLQESGLGDNRVSHAGLPVQKGQKVGMNIWVKRDFGW